MLLRATRLCAMSADEANRQSFDAAELLADGEDVEQALESGARGRRRPHYDGAIQVLREQIAGRRMRRGPDDHGVRCPSPRCSWRGSMNVFSPLLV